MPIIDTSTAAASRPQALPLGTPGWFTEGDPTTNQGATIPGQDWFNDLNGKEAAMLAAAGISLGKGEGGDNDWLNAIRQLAAPDYYAGMPGHFVFPGGIIANWTAAPSASTWDAADEGEYIHTVSWHKPFTTACWAAWCQVLTQADASLTDVTYNLVAPPGTASVIVRRNRFKDPGPTLTTGTRAFIFGVGK